MCLYLPLAANAFDSIDIGIALERDPARIEELLTPIRSTIEEQAPQYNWRFHSLTPDELLEDALARRLDAVFVNPYLALSIMQQDSQARLLLTWVPYANGNPMPGIGGTILARAGDTRYHSLEALRGARVAITSRLSFGAYAAPLGKLMARDPALADSLEFVSTGSNEASLRALQAGDVDAAFIDSGILEDEARQGHVAMSDFRVVAQEDLAAHPLRFSTYLYPGHALLALPSLSDARGALLIDLLLELRRALPEDATGGFSLPANYLPVESLVRDLQLPPYDKQPDITLADLWRTERLAFVAILTALAMLALVTLVLLIYLRQQRRTLALEHRVARRERALRQMPFTMRPDRVQAFIQDQLAVAETITDSALAFAHFVNSPIEDIQCATWSRRTLDAYRPAALKQCFTLLQAGILADVARSGEALIVNNGTAETTRRSNSAGDAKQKRMLVVPVRDEDVEMLLGVANKPSDYDDEDLESLQLLADQLWRVVRRGRLEAELEHRAYYDPLTGIPNRVLGSEALKLAMQQCARRGTLVAAAFIDLDHFKDINDSYGHPVGDEALRVTARRMRIALREGDTLARLGGDEFLAVLPDLPDEEAASVVLERMLAMVAEPISHAEAVIHPSASVGISVYTATMGPLDPEQLIRQADRAMYDAKTAGRKTWRFFDHAVNTAIERHHQLAREVEQGIPAGEFRVYYQPKVSLDTGAITSVEALVRWEHPERGLLSPGQFIPQLRNHRILSGLGDWMLQRSLQEMQSLAPALRPPSVSINIAPRHLLEGDFVARVRKAVALLEPEGELRLELEILETSALENLDEVEAIIEECAELGVDFALDDFGSGYSSLVYLHALPIRVLKIDQTFVIGMLEDASDIAILRSIIALGKAMQLKVVAEGAETREHLQLLRALGCAEAQGYAISAPVPLEALRALLTQWQPSRLLERAEGNPGEQAP